MYVQEHKPEEYLPSKAWSPPSERSSFQRYLLSGVRSAATYSSVPRNSTDDTSNSHLSHRSITISNGVHDSTIPNRLSVVAPRYPTDSPRHLTVFTVSRYPTDSPRYLTVYRSIPHDCHGIPRRIRHPTSFARYRAVSHPIPLYPMEFHGISPTCGISRTVHVFALLPSSLNLSR